MTATRLYRGARDRVIAGVCGGLAHSLGIDPTIIRLFFVLGVGPGLNVLLYPLRRSAIR